MDIKIEYDGKAPTLCKGNLTAIVDGKEYKFPHCSLRSGGLYAEDCEEINSKGPWTISKYPVGFPQDLKKPVLKAINEQVERGCCGGCM